MAKYVKQETIEYREWLLDKLIEFGDKPFATFRISHKRLYTRGSTLRHLDYDLYPINGGTHIRAMYTITDRGRKYLMKVMQ